MKSTSVVAIALGVVVLGFAVTRFSLGPPETPMAAPTVREASTRQSLGGAPDAGRTEAQAREVPAEGTTPDSQRAPAVLMEGLVTDVDGHPLAEATVAAMTPPRLSKDKARPSGEVQAKGEVQRFGDYESTRFETRTDAAGRFVLELPEAGPYILVAYGEDFVVTRLERVEAPVQDLRLVLHAGGHVEGTVVSARGEPLPEVALTLFAEGKKDRTTECMSDEEGRFVMRIVEPGRYTLRAVFNTGAPHRASRFVEVRPKEQSTVVFRMDTGKSVSGVVVDEAGMPLAGAQVKAHSQRENHAQLNEQEHGIRLEDASSLTDEAGRFTVHHLLRGDSNLTVEKPGYVLRVATRGEDDAFDPLPEHQVAAGSTNVRLVLRYLGSIRGKLRRSDGAPIDRFTVNEESFQGEDGAFRLRIQQPGVTWLTLEAPGHTRIIREVRVERGQDVDLGTLVVEAGRWVRGRVVDATTSAPVENAQVVVRRSPSSQVDESSSAQAPELASAKTDPSGAFEFGPMEAGPLAMEVSHSGYLPLQQSVGSGEETLEVVLSQGARLEGTVKDREGQPAKVTLRLSALGGQKLHRSGIVDVSEGSFSMGGLEPGEYVISLSSRYDFMGNPWSETQSGRYVPRRVTLAPNERRVLQLQEREGHSTLRLRVPRVTGTPPEDVALHQAVLVPGTLSPIRSYGRVERIKLELGVLGPAGVTSPEVVYDALPSGRYTFLLVGRNVKGGPYLLHAEELVVPEVGVLTKDLQPVWKPIEHIIL
ncbi:carboxypeptidase regulatory-like domain-containing protein [Myxococcus sp. CA051A]|uniref:carboxypeptidase-like regulatory domain-containing protein n=1 Tax=Myxococcus sp. CA051A TaxID=2741739 RepID=UPI00157B4A0C|nr:carboxypeptidase-like regulatory domain-containing protein [Myxococcus sp. CA051A]NTX62932.1 carboxypeptidase regulatory-like domain-containing protein [Myxococcus sp. CA051A]